MIPTAESALRSLDSTFLDLLPAAVYVCDAAGLIQYCNRRATELWGRRPRYGDPEQRFCGSVQLFYSDGTCMPHAATPMAEALRTGGAQHNQEAIIARPDGSRITVMINIDVLRDETGALLGAVNVFQDITARKRAEQHHAAQLGITRILAEAASIGEAAPRLLQTTCEYLHWSVGILWTVDPQANVLRCAEVWHRPFLQIPEFEAASRQRTFPPGVGLPGRVWVSGEPHWIRDTVTDTNFPRALIAARERLYSGFGFPVRLGMEVLGVMEFFSEEHRQPDSALLEMMAGIGSQIGQFLDRKRAEEALRQSEAQLRAVLDYAPVFLCRCDKERRFTFVNQGYAQRFGLQPEDLIGKHVAEGLGAEAYESFRQYVDVVLTGQPVEFEVDVPYARGGRRYMHCAYVPDRNPAREVEGWIAVITDITARRRTEEQLREQTKIAETLNRTLAQRVAERTAELTQANIALQAEMLQHKQAREQLEHQQEALAHREKLAAMGSMLASVAHELNNPLAVVMMQADLLLEEASSSPVTAYAREITRAAGRCVEIVNHFLSLARQQPPVRTQVGLNTVVEAAMTLLTYPLRVDSITVEYRLAEDLPVLWADPHQLQQVVVNLVSNAHQALRDTAGPRQVTITTQADHDRQRVVLEVADTGPGIPPAIQQRIFEPFFTTRPLGLGTGLGLPLCLGIVERHGGTLSVASTPGQGAVFRVELPVEAMPADTVSSAPTPLPAAVPKAILLVDDEPGITRALAYLLRRDGHIVETAANGRVALEKCQARDYELILCDLRMPELDGPGFYQELEHCRPHLCQRIIFLTGDTLSPEAQEFVERTGVPRLNKPFTMATIRQAIQRL